MLRIHKTLISPHIEVCSTLEFWKPVHEHDKNNKL